MVIIKEHLDLLGYKVQDRVTGFKGVATTVGFDLYGCVQVLVNPGVGMDCKLLESYWFDINRLEKVSSKPVMERPAFDYTPEEIARGDHGPENNKPVNKV